MDQIGRYRIESELGRGGFGCVYRAIDPTVGRAVAIKVLISDGDPDMLARFRNEAAATGKLRHKNIVTIYDYGEQDGVPYLVMEYLDGQDLEKIQASGRRLTLFEKVSIMSQVAEGLRHAHMNGIVHRDVKPANIMVLADGSAKIMDFGIARLVTSRSTRLTLQGNLIGTLPYMAPEQLQGGEVDQLCDIFAFGTILYWLITGVQPFTAPDPGSVIYRVTSMDPAPVRSLAADCPQALEEVIARAMQKPRELRYQSLEDLQFDTAPIRLQLEAELSVAYITDASKAYEAGDLDTAHRLIWQASELNPNNPKARELRERIRHDAQLKLVRERSAAALATAHNQMVAGQFTDAIRVLEGALRVDPDNTELSKVLEEVKGAATRARRAAALLDEARRELASHNLTNAYRSAMECLQNSPDNQEATALLATIRKEIEQRERERRLQQMLTEVQSLADAKSYDQALSLLADLEAGYPASQRVKQLLAAVHFARDEEERQRRLAQVLATAKQAIEESRWQDAVEQLEPLKRAFPSNDEVATLLAYSRDELAAKRKADEIDRILRESRALTEAREFQSALNLIKGGLRAWSDDPALINVAARVEEARRAFERENAIDEATRRVEEHLGMRHYSEALLEVNAAIRVWDSNRLRQLHSRVEKETQEYERDKAVEDLCAAARGEAEAGRFADAIHGLESGLDRLGADPRLDSLLAEVRARYEEQQRDLAVMAVIRESTTAAGRQDFDSAISQVAQALHQYPHESTLLAQLRRLEGQRLDHLRNRAESLGQTRRWGEAIELIESLLKEYPGHNELLALRHRVQEDWDRTRREEAIAAAIDKAESLKSAGELEAAISSLEAALAQFPGEARFTNLLSETRRLRDAELRAGEIRGLADRASELVHRRQFEQAIAALTEGVERYPEADTLPPILQRAREAQAEAQRRAAIQQVIAEATDLLAIDEFDEAIAVLRKGISELIRAPELAALLDHAAAAKDAKERQVAVEKALERGSGLLAEQSHDAAIAVVQRTLDIYPGEAQLNSLLHRALQAKADWERKRRVGAALETAAKLRDSGNPAKAMKALEPVLREYPEERPLLDAYAALRGEVERRTALDHLLARAHAFKRGGNFADALQVLDEAAPTFPGEPQIDKLRGDIERARTDAEVTAAVNSIETLRSNGRIREAAAELDAAVARYPDRKLLVRLQSPLAADLEALKRREEASMIAREAQVLLEHGKLAESITVLEEALVTYPGEAELVTLLAYAQETAEARRRAEAIAEVTHTARALLSSGKAGDAVTILEAAQLDYPNEEAIVPLLDRARAEQAAAARGEGIRQALAAAENLRAQRRHTDAIQCLEEAVARHGTDPAFKQAAQRIRSEAEAWEREERVHRAVAAAHAELDARRPESAGAILRQALAADPQDTRLTALLETADRTLATERREATVRDALSSAESAASRHDYDSALSLLRDAEGRTGPDERLSSAAADLQTRQSTHVRQTAIENALREAAVLENAGRYDEAIATVTAVLDQYPGTEALLDRKQAIESAVEQERQRRRTRGIEEALAAASKAATGQQFDAALKCLRDAERDLGHEPRLAAAISETEKQQAEWARQSTIDAATRNAATLLGQQRYADAVSVLSTAISQYPDERALIDLKRRIATEEEEARKRKRAEDIERALASAAAAVAASQFDNALDVLRKASQAVAGDAVLEKAIADVEAKKQVWAKQLAVSSAQKTAEAALAKQRWSDASSAVNAALEVYPGEPALLDLKRRIAAEEEEARKRKRAEDIARALSSAAAAVAASQFDNALDVLRKVSQEVGGDAGLEKAIAGVEAKKQGWVKQLTISSAQKTAEAALAKQQWGEASSAVNAALEKFPGEPALLDLKQRIATEEEEARKRKRAEDIERALASAGAAVAASQFDNAFDVLRKVSQAVGGDAALEKAIVGVEAQKQVWAKQFAISSAQKTAETALAKQRWGDASAGVNAALEKFPGEPALLDLKQRIATEEEEARKRKRAEDIERALASAGASVAASQFDNALDVLRKESQAVGGDAVLEKAIADVEAKKQVWAKQLAVSSAQKTAEAALAKKRRDDASSVVNAALEKYPGEPALLQLRTRIEQEAEQDKRARQRKADLEALKQFAVSAKKAKSVEALDEIEASRTAIAAAHPGDAEIAAALKRVEVEVDAARKRLAPAPAKAPAPEPQPTSAPARRPIGIYVAVAGGVAALAAIGLYLGLRKPAVAAHTVQIAYSPATAAVSIGSQSCTESPCRVPLVPGHYELKVQAPGYEASARQLTVANQDLSLDVALRPLATTLRISSNLETGSVSLDGRSAGSLQGGELSIANLAPGTHALRVSGPEGAEASLSFESNIGALPAPAAQLDSRNLQALTAASLGNRVSIRAAHGEPVTVDGISLPSSGEVVHPVGKTLEIRSGTSGSAYALASSEAPALTLFLHANRDTGTLLVETGQDGAAVYVDQHRYSRNTELGIIRIPLATGAHAIRVEKPGYQAPAPQHVQIAKDELQHLTFALRPQPGTLVVASAIPGLEVALDGAPLGTVQGRGSFPVTPGDHTVELSKTRYQSRRIPVRIAPGAVFEISRMQSQLTEVAAPAVPPPPKVVEVPRPGPTPEALRPDLRDWDAVKDSRDPSALEAFRRKYPDSPLASQARQRIEQLEKQAEAAAWEGLNKKDVNALKAYLAQHLSSPYRGEAEKALGQLAATDRTKRDQEEIGQALARYAHAIEAKDATAIQSIWPGISAGTLKDLRDTFKASSSLSMELTPSSIQVTGDSAVAACSRRIIQESHGRRESSGNVSVRLRRTDHGWVIDSMQ